MRLGSRAGRVSVVLSAERDLEQVRPGHSESTTSLLDLTAQVVVIGLEQVVVVQHKNDRRGLDEMSVHVDEISLARVERLEGLTHRRGLGSRGGGSLGTKPSEASNAGGRNGRRSGY